MKLGLIGCGKMGGALLAGVIKANLVKPSNISVCDKFPEAARAFTKKFKGLKNVKGPAEVAAASDVILLAVKPQDMQKLLVSLAPSPKPQAPSRKRRASSRSRLFISIAAGVTLAQLRSWLGGAARVIRVMPNTPAQIGLGYSAFARGAGVTGADAALARKIFDAVGLVDEVEEKLIDAVTGLSGSGPAYVFTVIEALADAGVLMGLPRAAALRAAAQTVAGAAQLVVQTGEHPATLRDNVASPGGTTIAGLEQLEKHGLRNALLQAVRRATERSKELAK